MKPEFGNLDHIRLRDMGVLRGLKKNLQNKISCLFCGCRSFSIEETDVLNDRYWVKFDCVEKCRGFNRLFSIDGNANFYGQKYRRTKTFLNSN